ncbi:MAG TPA: thioredoxin family protein [Steroidobacteraceae bacterium]|jgi:protein disulfide-isomerase|nr:thioredoxin family protein [Steroidobacteraceae bacterium]
MNKFLLALAAASLATAALAAPWPYNEQADAAADVQHAIAAAQADHKKVLLVFGANWCPDCRALDRAMHGSSRHLIDSEFDVVKIDVGNFDKNLTLAKRYGNPIAKGIPAVVVVGSGNQVLYSTRGGELANAGQMTEQSIYDFLKAKVANRS